MKKIINKNFIFGLIVGILFCGISVFASTLLRASDVSYVKDGNTISNVQTVLDELILKSNAGNATSSQLLKDTSALVKGSLVTGSMPNKTGWNNTPTESGKVTIPEGYHDGNGYVDTSSVYNLALQDVATKRGYGTVSDIEELNSKMTNEKINSGIPAIISMTHGYYTHNSWGGQFNASPSIVIKPNGCKTITLTMYATDDSSEYTHVSALSIGSVTNATFSGSTITVTDSSQNVTVTFSGLSFHVDYSGGGYTEYVAIASYT